MTKASFHLPEHPAQKKPKYSVAVEWNDATVYAAHKKYAITGTCGYPKCRRDDPIVYAFPGSPGYNPPAYHWQCFQRVMDDDSSRQFRHLTSDVYPKKRVKVIA